MLAQHTAGALHGYSQIKTQEVEEMNLTRREFLVFSGVVGSALTLSSLGLDLGPAKAYAEELKIDKLKSAKLTTTVCPYCSVGCGLIAATDTKASKIVNIEGDPDHPVNRGSGCAKGATMRQLSADNPWRLTKPLYRKPGGTEWEEKSWDWAIDRIAQNIKNTRDNNFTATDSAGNLVNRTDAIANLGGSALDNEECYLLAKLTRALGVVYLEHHARI